MSIQTRKKNLKQVAITKETTIRDLLIEHHLEKAYFVVIVDGKKALLDDIVRKGQSVIVLPRIAGG